MLACALELFAGTCLHAGDDQRAAYRQGLLPIVLVFTLLSLPGLGLSAQTPVFKLLPALSGVGFGRPLTRAGDMDGDGVEDFVFLQLQGPSPLLHAYSGASLSPLFSIGVPPDPGGISPSLAHAGDVNGDGYDDVAVGRPNSATGQVLIYGGPNGDLLQTFVGGAMAEAFGQAVDGAGDVDADGYDDVIVGDFRAGASDKGRAIVFSGKDGSKIHNLPGIGSTTSAFGISVSGLEDIDGDGYDDFGVVTQGYGSDANVDLVVFSGQDASVLHAVKGPGFITKVSELGDVDGDGGPDFLSAITTGGVAAKGRAAVYSGSSGKMLYLLKADETQSGFASDVDSVGDLNGDGACDFLVTAPNDTTVYSWAGSVWVYSGRDGTPLFPVFGTGYSENLGRSASGIGDLTGDGVPDLLVSGQDVWFGGVGAKHYVKVISGRMLDLPGTVSTYGYGCADAIGRVCDLAGRSVGHNALALSVGDVACSARGLLKLGLEPVVRLSSGSCAQWIVPLTGVQVGFSGNITSLGCWSGFLGPGPLVVLPPGLPPGTVVTMQAFLFDESSLTAHWSSNGLQFVVP